MLIFSFKQVVFVNVFFIYLSVVGILPFFTSFFQIFTCVDCIQN